MQYAKVKDGQVERIGLPTTGVLTQVGFEGCSISGYDKLPYTSDAEEPTLQLEGWLPLTDNPPVYNAETEYLEHAGYMIGASEVVVNYLVKQVEVQIVDDPVDDEKVAMAEAIIDLETRLSVLEGGVA
jgi:hypothetical protein